MEPNGSSQTNPITMKKPKKKQPINSESDRQKQAEKKKRRLEKALATSRAIISELEKKKQRKIKEEEKRLDQEGAHIAEAVALQVLEDPGKNQPVNPESDCQKQAEKKKRRLEKALAASAAIILELEKKKQKMREEQERLDQEGARIAEAVALHVLIGEDSTEDPGQTHLGPVRPVMDFGSQWGTGGLLFPQAEWGTGGVLFPWVGPVWGEIDFEFCPAEAVSSLQIREDGLQDGNNEFNLLQGV